MEQVQNKKKDMLLTSHETTAECVFQPGIEKAVCRFSELAAQAAVQGETAIGVVTSSAGARHTCLNPGADARWTCEDTEQVIVLGAVLPHDTQAVIIKDEKIFKNEL